MLVHDVNAIEDFTGEVVAAHIYPADCSNLISTMKSIIGGFIDKSSNDDEEALCAWVIGQSNEQHTHLTFVSSTVRQKESRYISRELRCEPP